MIIIGLTLAALFTVGLAVWTIVACPIAAANDYIPAKDGDAADWANNFAGLITADPTTYGLEAGDAATIQTAADEYSAALVTATDPSTRTSPKIAEKDTKRKSMEDVCRPYAMQINANPAVTDEQRTDLGLTVRAKTPTPKPPITDIPVINVRQWNGTQACIDFANSATPTSKAKGKGNQAVEIDVDYPDGQGGWLRGFTVKATKTPVYIPFQPSVDQRRLTPRFIGPGPDGTMQEGPDGASLVIDVPNG